MNAMDTGLYIRPPNIRSILATNINVSTLSGRELPLCLEFDSLASLFDDTKVHYAIEYAIDRDELVAVG